MWPKTQSQRDRIRRWRAHMWESTAMELFCMILEILFSKATYVPRFPRSLCSDIISAAVHEHMVEYVGNRWEHEQELSWPYALGEWFERSLHVGRLDQTSILNLRCGAKSSSDCVIYQMTAAFMQWDHIFVHSVLKMELICHKTRPCIYLHTDRLKIMFWADNFCYLFGWLMKR